MGPFINPVVADQKERSPVPKLMLVGQVCSWEKPAAAKNIAARKSKYFFIHVLIGATKKFFYTYLYDNYPVLVGLLFIK